MPPALLLCKVGGYLKLFPLKPRTFHYSFTIGTGVCF